MNNKMEKLSGIVNLSRMLVSSIEEAKSQEIRHLTNPRCKRADFSNVRYALGCLAKNAGVEEPTTEEAELICRNVW